MDETEVNAESLTTAPADGMATAASEAAGTAGNPVLAGIQELVQAGGPVVVILLVMSVVALGIIFAKLWQFHRARLGDRKLALGALALYQAGRPDEALARLSGARNPVAQTLARAIRGQQRGIDETRVREEVVRYGGDVLEALRGLFRPLEVIASLAPLLGLFGTVLGMIDAFQNLAAAGNQVDPAVLSGGIWEALLTTAAGLAVAIPVVMILNWLERRVDRVAFDLDSIVTRVFTEDLSEVSEARTHGEQSGPERIGSAAFAAGD
ncbi:MAG: MotA/TolQ/ExbB proton channel family protein [Pseudomonadota bacterium]